jgi:MFS family permease
MMLDPLPHRSNADPANREALAATFIAAAVDTVGVLPIYLTGAMAIQLRSAIGLEISGLGLVFAAYFTAAALLSAPVGRLTERVDPAVFLRGGCTLCAVALLGMSRVGSASWLLVLVVLAGVATSLTRTASSVLVARTIRFDRQGLALGVRNCAIPAAALLSGVAVPSVALTVGWRWAFVIAAGLSATVLLALPRSIPRAPRASRSGESQIDMPLPFLTGLAVAAALASAAAVSLGAFTAVTAVHAGMNERSAGILIATGSVVGVVSRVVVGWWTDRRPGSQLDVVIGMMAVGAAGYGLVSLAVEPLLWLAVPAAHATGWAFYGSYYLSVIRLNPIAPGAAVGIAQSGAFAGSILGPVVFGTLASRATFSVAWLTAALASLVAVVIVLAVETRAVRNT